jgi:hypothetical protein
MLSFSDAGPNEVSPRALGPASEKLQGTKPRVVGRGGATRQAMGICAPRAPSRRRHGFEAVPIWRPSSTGRDKTKRGRNLKISPSGIRDFGVDRGYTPLDLVLRALDCDLDAAFAFLSERLGWSSGDVSIAIPDLTLEDLFKAGFTKEELRGCEQMREVCEALGFKTVLKLLYAERVAGPSCASSSCCDQ